LKPKGLNVEAQRAEAEVGSWEEAAKPFPTSLGSR